jgi:hypothetical protein
MWLDSGRKDRTFVTHRKSLGAWLLALAVLLAACGGDDNSDPTSTTATDDATRAPNALAPLKTGRDVQAPDGRYSLRVPGEWVQYDDPIAELAFRTVGEDPSLSFNVVREDVGDNPRVQAYAEDARNNIGNTYSNVISLSLTAVKIGTVDAYRWIYTATVGQRQHLFYQVYVVEHSQGFVLTGLAPMGTDVDTVRSTFDAIVGSMTFARG